MGIRSKIGDVEGRITNLLHEVPGYSGYRDKESRRDEDKRLRDAIALDVRNLVDTLTRYNSELAAERDFESLNRLEDVVNSLRLLGDRIRTASYGYGGIFADVDVNESALDQLRQFDLALERDVTNLEQELSTLTRSMPPKDDDVRAFGNEIERLQTVFDGRSEVITNAQPTRDSRVLELLETPDQAPPSPLLMINRGDTFSVLGDNYLTDATIRVTADDGTIVLARVTGSDEGATWFVASDISGVPTARTTESTGVSGGYQTMSRGVATVDGVNGRQENVPVYYSISTADESLELRVSIADQMRMFRGNAIRDIDIEVYGAAQS